MKFKLLYYTKILIKFIVKTFYGFLCIVTPTDKNKIVICSHLGRTLGCNVKYVANELLRRKLPYKLVRLYRADMFDFAKADPNIKLVDWNNNYKKMRELASAKLWLEGDHKTFEYMIGLRKKKNQFYLNTFHGSLGIKKIYHDEEVNVRSKKFMENFDKNFDDCDIMFSNSKFEENVYRSGLKFKNKIFRTGHARNDILFKDNTKIKQKVLSKLNIPNGKKIALYAPSYRDDLKTNCFSIDYNILKQALEKKYNCEWVIVSRFHSVNALKSKTKINDIMSEYDATYYPDMQELIVSFDLLISDFSSCMFDFMLTKKPVFVFATDIEKYNNERGLYYPLEKTPFLIASNNEELEKNILKFDYEKYKKDIELFLEDKQALEDGHASERIADIIEQLMQGKDIKNINI